MSDRTQTFSVEIKRKDAEALVSDSESTDAKRAKVLAQLDLEDKLQVALSQPEHQGDEKTFQQAVYDASVAMTEALNPHLGRDEWDSEISALVATGMPEALRAALPYQPPAPALSDEKKERLEQIADSIYDLSGVPPWPDDADFLRDLVSQEHRGEVTRVRQLETLPDNWDSYGGVPPTEQALERLRGFDRALTYVPLHDGGVQVEFHALGLDFEAVIDTAGKVNEYSLESQEHRGEGQ